MIKGSCPNNWPTNKSGVNAAVIVAHPDDETIFCGGTMLSYPLWNWYVVCATMQTNTSRPQEFQNTMSMYQAYGVNIVSYLTLEKHDEGQDLPQVEIDDWKESIQRLGLSSDIVFTHNAAGEYGHNHHKVLNKVVCELFKNVWEFICPGAVNVAPQPFKESIRTVPLNLQVLNQKAEIFNRCYTSQLATWKVLPELMIYEFRTGPEIFTSG